ncbi:MAG: Hsp70 family protein, partial [Dehalococcoidia bacterium]|nr:Hsp70 family protein [Dehalococcoidia bacterium]
VEKMQKEAESYAAEDANRKEEVEVRNSADSLAYTAEKTLRDYGDKIPAEVRQEIESKIAAVKSALQGKDVNPIRTSTQDLSQAMQKIGASVYQQPGQQPPPAGEEPPGGKPDEGGEGTVEGEFREV